MSNDRCAKKFSEEDKAELMEMGLKIQGYRLPPSSFPDPINSLLLFQECDTFSLARYNCFKEMFHSACQKSVKGQIYAFFQVFS